jgi:hypothetical protein
VLALLAAQQPGGDSCQLSVHVLLGPAAARNSSLLQAFEQCGQLLLRADDAENQVRMRDVGIAVGVRGGQDGVTGLDCEVVVRQIAADNDVNVASGDGGRLLLDLQHGQDSGGGDGR